jgi:hypothetical protein
MLGHGMAVFLSYGGFCGEKLAPVGVVFGRDKEVDVLGELVHGSS